MQKDFFPVLRKRPSRARFYSSMTSEEFYQIYGPPCPIFRPQDDPVEDIPLFDLQAAVTADHSQELQYPQQQANNFLRMETIQQIEGSQNFSLKDKLSPRPKDLAINKKLSSALDRDGQSRQPLERRRMRSQSDNSQYLIFNFLQRNNQKGRKRLKID